MLHSKFAQEIKWKLQPFSFKKGKIKIKAYVKDALRPFVTLNSTLFLLIDLECMKHAYAAARSGSEVCQGETGLWKDKMMAR